MSSSMNEGLISSTVVGAVRVILIALISSTTVVSNTYTLACNGTVNFLILYEDGMIRNVSVNHSEVPAVDQTDTPTTALQRFHFNQHESFAGENGIEIEEHHVQLIPGGSSGERFVHLFNYTTKTWTTIDVYCPPLGLSYRRYFDEIVGFCAVNYSSTCVPYFKLHIEDGQWVDVSRSGFCSLPLSTTNITNPVILQSDSDNEVDATRLYFAERGTNRLHEVYLSAVEARYYETDPTLKIDHLIPVNNASFLGLRVVCHRVDDSSDFYHKLFLWQLDSTQQQQTGFIGGAVQTESVAFDSYHLDYLVTFNANRNTVIIYKDRQSQYYKNLPTLDYPLQCQNLAEPSAHYLICVAGNGHLPLLINLTGDAVTNMSVSSDELKKVVRIGVLAKGTFYLLNNQQELSVCLLTSTVWCLKPYTVRTNIDFIIPNVSSDINCTVTEAPAEHNATSSHSVSVVVFMVPIIVGVFIIGIVMACWFVKKKLMNKGHINSRYSKMKSHEGFTTMTNGEQRTINQADDSDRRTCDNVAASNLPLQSTVSDDNSGLQTGPVSLGVGPNNERIIFTTENDSNLAYPQEADTYAESEVVYTPVPNRIPYIMYSGAPAERCDTERRNLEHDSNQPEEFVEAKSETKAVQCTNKNSTVSLPPPDAERYVHS